VGILKDAQHAEEVVHIEASSSNEADAVYLTIQADGVYFSQDRLRELSDYLARADEEFDDDIADLDADGMTWTVIKNIIHLHDGAIELSQTGEYQFEVTIRLPVYEAQGASVRG
jgi:K+-sensing histidine kinase KdpD